MKNKLLLFGFCIFSFQLLGKEIKYFDAGNGTNYERYIAETALNCITKNCAFDFLRNDFGHELIIDNSTQSDLIKISKMISESTASRKRFGFLTVDESFLTFTRTLYSASEFEFLYQIELKLIYVGGILKAESIKINKNSQIRIYQECEECGEFGVLGYLGKRVGLEHLIPPPPPPPSPDFIFHNLASYPLLCECNSDIVKADNESYLLKNKKLNYQYLRKISEKENFGYYIAKLKNSFGIIDTNNNVIIPFEYQFMRALDEDVILIKQKDKYGVTTIFNDLILPIDYEGIRIIHYSDSSSPTGYSKRFLVRKNEKEGLLSMSGDVVIPIIYDKLWETSFQRKRYFRAELNEKWKFLDNDGKVLTKIEYDKIGQSSSPLFKFDKNNKSKVMVPKKKKMKRIKSLEKKE